MLLFIELDFLAIRYLKKRMLIRNKKLMAIPTKKGVNLNNEATKTKSIEKINCKVLIFFRFSNKEA